MIPMVFGVLYEVARGHPFGERKSHRNACIAVGVENSGTGYMEYHPVPLGACAGIWFCAEVNGALLSVDAKRGTVVPQQV